MKKRILPLLVISFLSLAFSVNDISALKTLVLNRLTEYAIERYPEKIYIHTDKHFYIAGEDIWFNAYLINGITHRESSKSSVIYVELINEKDSIISELKLFSELVSAEGDFRLPKDLNDGIYNIRAYTNYMQNQPKEFFFKKEIEVNSLYAEESGLENDENRLLPTNLDLPEISFYPESGYLVYGLNNKVAIKISDTDLDAKTIHGFVEDTDGNKITDFQTHEFGLGSFYLKPEMGKRYRAVIPSADENLLYTLPIPLAEGYVMNTSISDKELTIELSTNKEDGLKNTLIIGHQRGIPVFDYVEKKNKSSVLLKVSKDDLAEGVLDLILFNDTEKPVAERLVYVQKENEIALSVNKINGTSTKTRDRVDLKIEVRDLLGKIVPSSLSLSITDANIISPDENAENIRTYLLLNSDLRGKIRSPNYFFTRGDEVKKNTQLDLIMMTHGWRRFDWLEFLETRSREKFKPEDGIYINGYTISAKPPYQYKMSETKMALRQEGFYQESQPTDKYGRFSYGPFVFNDTVNILFQAGDYLSSDKPDFETTNIVLDPPVEKPRFHTELTNNSFYHEISKEDQVSREQARNYIFRNFEYDQDRELLTEVVVKGKVETQEEIKNKERNKRTRSFQPSHRVIVDDMGRHGGNNFTELLTNIPSITIGIDKYGDEQVNLRGMRPSFYLNNIKVDMKTVLSVPQANIDFIDVLNTGHASAAYSLEAQGIIAIYTKRGSREKGKTKKQPGSITFKSSGFYSARSFYSPDYSKVDKNSNRKDERSTLYWNPKLTVTPFKGSEVTFYTSDEKGPLQIEIQGITESGIPIYTTSILEVE